MCDGSELKYFIDIPVFKMPQNVLFIIFTKVHIKKALWKMYFISDSCEIQYLPYLLELSAPSNIMRTRIFKNFLIKRNVYW